MIHTYYILLGTNLGNKKRNLENAVRHISDVIGSVITFSSIYHTKAWGKRDQNNFLNQVLKIETEKQPQTVLERCMQIEKKMGRIRYEKWGSRLIDIDILYWDDQVMESKKLVIPHPEIQNRRFTLVPLVELASEYIHPILQQSNHQLLEGCQDSLHVEKLS